MKLSRWIPLVIMVAFTLSPQGTPEAKESLEQCCPGPCCPPTDEKLLDEKPLNVNVKGSAFRPSSQPSASPKGAIQQLQEALQSRGHDPGPIDGLIGPKTKAAIKSFQASQGIEASGEVDEKTAQALGVPLPSPGPKPNHSGPKPPTPKPKPGGQETNRGPKK